MYQSQAPRAFLPHPPWCPYICSLCLCVYFCFANRFICTIFLHIYSLIQESCFSFWLTSLSMTLLSFLQIGKETAAAAKSLQSCLTLCSPRDGSPPGSPIPGILQARTLEWVAMSFFNAWKWKVKGHAWLLATPWTAAPQAPPSMGFSRQRYCSGVPLPSPREGDCSIIKVEAALNSQHWQQLASENPVLCASCTMLFILSVTLYILKRAKQETWDSNLKIFRTKTQNH